MRRLMVLLLLAAPGATAQQANGCCGADVTTAGLAIAERYRVAALSRRSFTHTQFWRAVAPSLDGPVLRVTDLGRSLQGRALRAVTFGAGATSVLLWSQMHGDESTATMALADIFRYLAEAHDDPMRERLRRELTIVFLPMLNPDGAEGFQRHNAAGIDVNRDARRLATPEARALSGLQDSLKPHFGFNLHDQNARTRAGERGLQAAIALLPPAYDSARSYNEVRSRARHVAAVIASLLAHEIPGRVSRYDDTYSPRAFGDIVQQRGTSTVLIESGALPDDPQKQRLRALNVAAILGALTAIATDGYREVDPDRYEELPENRGGAHDILVLGGRLVLPGSPPVVADLALNYDNPVARTGPRLVEVGDLQDYIAIDTVDAAGQFIFPAGSMLSRDGGRVRLRLQVPVRLDLRRGPQRNSALVRRIGE